MVIIMLPHRSYYQGLYSQLALHIISIVQENQHPFHRTKLFGIIFQIK